MPIRILIIEDEPDYAFLTKTILEKVNKDYQPDFVCNAKEGLKKIIEEKPDVVVCDYRMPELTGIDILRKIKKEGLDIPFIVVTASGNEKIAVDFMKEGASDYVLKDIGYEEALHLAIENSLEKYKIKKDKERLEQEIKQAYTKLKETQKELIQSEKLSALGRFSSKLAHEVKNPLGIILSGIEFLEIDLSSASDDTKMALEKIKEAALRADSIIQRLLKFTKPSETEIEKIKPEDLINDVISLIKYRCSLENIEIKTEFSEDIYIEVDKNQIQQVILNILMNAVESMPKGGIIKIKVYKKLMPEYFLENSVCIIEIADTGEGISKENLPKLFEPFFSTKREKKGTGLGLSIAKTIIDNHKGKLVIDSQLGKGTTVKIILQLPKGA